MNFKEDRWNVISKLDKEIVRGYHLAGCTKEHKGDGIVYIDYHAEAVSESVWELNQQCLDHFGPWPTLLEWENNVPPLTRTLEEVARIKRYQKPYHNTIN